MSDLYDSLEDECDENKYSSGYPEDDEPPLLIERVPTAESLKKYSFYLCQKSNAEKRNFGCNKVLLSAQQKNNFLPKIESNIGEKGPELIRKLALESKILTEHGLQLNKDGSITKSPRAEAEKLPFITREYRNLQFQKKKTYADVKKATPPNVQKKSTCNENDNEKSGIVVKQRSPKRKKNSFEKIMTGSSSICNTNQPKPDNHNMTDSMKEKLLQNQKDNCKTIKKPKCKEFETSKAPRHHKYWHEKQGGQTKTYSHTHRLQKNCSCLDSSQKQIKTSKPKICGYMSDISLTTLRPKLNYSDRHKLENGFNIYHLKQLNKKVESDTNRSNFGDSVMGELPEVSSVPVTRGNSAREDEELYYKKLIEKDKCLKQQSHYSARSEGVVSIGKLRNAFEERKNLLKSKSIIKSMNIDLDAEVDNLVNSFKKITHYCPASTSTKPSKVELALKAKTYGYLANARNIFKLKVQSERKSNAPVKEDSLKILDNISPFSKRISDLSRGSTNLSRHISPTIGIFPNVKGGLPRYLERSPRGIKTLSKTKLFESSCESQKEIVLPQVFNQKLCVSKVQRHN